MDIKETLITPATATAWLEGNTHNRSLRDKTVARYARDMKAGRWRLTHQGIAFGPDGTLLDGQHRLWAIIEADTAIRMMVARGVHPDAQDVIDDNMPRSAADALKLRTGTAVRTIDIAIAKRILAETLHDTCSRQEALDVYAKHRDAIAFTSAAFPRMIRGVTTASVMTPVVRAWYSHPHDKLARFAEILSTGRLEDPHEDAALMLRNWLLEGASIKKAGASRTTVIYAKTERALAAFLRGEILAHLYAAPTELFPLPADLAEPRATRKIRAVDSAFRSAAR